MDPIFKAVPAIPYAILLLIGMFACLEVGRRIGISWRNRAGPEPPSFGTIESSVFGIFALLIAFTFSGAPARLDQRRQLIADECNAIGTAYLRLDLLGDDARPGIQKLFRDYLDARIAVYNVLPDLDAALAEIKRSEDLQHQIWAASLIASSSKTANRDATRLIVPALNEMFDITTTRTMSGLIHPPAIVFGLLFVMALICSTLAGCAMATNKTRSWLHLIAFAFAAVLAISVVLEIEYPRFGMLHVESSYDQVLIDLRAKMN
jgi:hypothetical protein